MFSKTIMSVTVLTALNLGGVQAINIDPFTFCTNTCKPSQCNDKSQQGKDIKAMCKKTCVPDNIWMQVASLELSKTNKAFRQSRDKTQKESMLYTSDIAQCLELKDPKIKEEKPKVEVPAPVESPVKAQAPAHALAPMPSKSGASMPNVRKDLCGPALQAEIDTLQKDKSMVDKQIESQIKELESALKGGPEGK